MIGGGTTSISSGATLTITGAAVKTLGARTINNSGSLIDQSLAGGRVELDGAAILNNLGTFEITVNGLWGNASGVVGTLVFNNQGTLKKTGGNGNFDFNNTTFTNTGVLTSSLGAIRVNGIIVVTA